MNGKEAEDSFFQEMLERHAKRTNPDDIAGSQIVPSGIEGIRFRIERVSALPPSALLRLGGRFWEEVDSK